VAPLDLAGDEAGTEPLIVLVRGTDRVDIGKLGSVTGKPRIRRATAREAGDATGYSIGGIPPFGHRQRISVVMDPALDAYPVVWAAAGTPSAVFAIAPATLAQLSDALVAPCAEDAGEPSAP
jgi:prolyl-tRNA editing enzyme YbaK/EbsC (Cys-tRNA(Pro) deacylase)